MVYKFTTPSDPITFLAEDDKVAFLVTVIVGNGKTLYEPEDGHNVPSSFLIFAGDQTEAMIEGALANSMDHFIHARRSDIIAALESFAYGEFADRKVYDQTFALLKDDPNKLDKFRAIHDDAKRSSLSEWCKYAWNLAKQLKSKPQPQPEAAQA